LVGIEAKKEHDKIVNEVLRRLEKNDLYVKPKKYIWKVQEIGFLKVIIGSNGIKIEKKKVNRVLS